jgi:hypothetical protein
MYRYQNSDQNHNIKIANVRRSFENVATFKYLGTAVTCQNLFREEINKKTPWSESASELYRPSDRRLSAKRLPTCADRGCHVISVTDPSGRILSDSKLNFAAACCVSVQDLVSSACDLKA